MTIEELESAIVERIRTEITSLSVVACPSDVKDWGPLAEKGAVFVRYDRSAFEHGPTLKTPTKVEHRYLVSVGSKSLRRSDGHTGAYPQLAAIRTALHGWAPEGEEPGAFVARTYVDATWFVRLDEKKSIWWFNMSVFLKDVEQ